MLPGPKLIHVEEPTTLRAFMEKLGKNYVYAFDRNVIGVLVNGRRLWPSARLKTGDEVVIFPIITGG
jgi:molybdopterin converting factor small subunit